MSAPLCRACGRPIPKKTATVWFTRDDPGHYVAEAVQLPELPATKAEAQRHTNAQIVSVSRSGYGPDKGRIARVGTWDGESYRDPFFCTDACARRLGYAAARAGYSIKGAGQ